MWNNKPSYPPKSSPTPQPQMETPRPPETSIAARVATLPPQNVSMIGKSVTITGDITGSEPLHVEGNVKGAIRLDAAYLNIGPEATVQSTVAAREVVVRGSVVGNVNVSERIDIRNGGSLIGDITAHSVSIEEGAYFKGSIDMRRAESARNKAPNIVTSSSPKPIQPEPAKAVSA